jgi:NDP-sugar pyrophosphorylase family protein
MTTEQFHNETNTERLRDVTVIMPIGGLATRARPVTGDAIPKHLIRLGNGRTVLDTITGGLQRVGFRDFVFCLGHHSEQLRDHIEDGSWISSDDTKFKCSVEDRPLGGDGAVVKAIGELCLTGQAMIIPGDIVLPWKSAAGMNIEHARTGADITVGVTSYITPRTTDVGKIVGETDTNRLLWCYARNASDLPQLPGSQNLTSAAAAVISIERYAEICEAYQASNPQAEGLPLGMRDNILPWVAKTHPRFNVQLYDIQGEMLDLGTPEKIRYGQENWEQYV